MGFEVGQRVADYEIVSLLGVGGMGRVYRVRNVISHRTEAMKVLLADLQAEPELAARFVGEIRTLAGLDHPNIAQLHTALQTSNELVMMMEFVDGSTLQQLARHAPLPHEKVVEYMHQVLAALNFAHGHGVVHRDIKPANIMVTPKGTVKLTDFGIAKSKAEDELTRPGTTVGSLYYMSPEQARGGRFVDGRSDIYSVGITLYELLAGRRPFEDESAYVILHNQLNVEPRPPIEVNPELSRPLSDLIMKTLEKDPDKRFKNAAALSDALTEATGIAPATPIRSTGVFISAAAGESESARVVSIAAGTARFPTARQRSSSRAASLRLRSLPANQAATRSVGARALAVQSLAVAAILASVGVGLPHLVKSGAWAKTVGHSLTQMAVFSPRTGERPVASAPTPVGLPAASVTHGVTSTVASPKPEVIVAAEPAPSTVVAVLQHPRAVSAKLSRVSYASIPPRNPAADVEDDTMSLPVASRSAEDRQVREQRTELDARASALKISVQRLKTQQSEDGAELSQYASVAYVRMNAFLAAEKTDLQDGDVAAAREHLSKAEFQGSILENLLGK